MSALLKTILSRPLLCLALGLCLGLAPMIRLSPWILVLLALAVFFLILYSMLLFKSGRDTRLCLSLFFLGVALGLLRAQPLARARAEAPAASINVARFTATVNTDLGLHEDKDRQALLLSDVHVENLETGVQSDFVGKVRLSYEPDAQAPALGPGDKIKFFGALRPALPPSNPGEFDYRFYLLGRGIKALASSRHASQPQRVELGSAWNPWRLAWSGRRALVAGLEKTLSPRAAALTRGIVFGDTGGLTSQDMSVYARTGIVFILCVAGLHLALAIAIFIWIAKWLGLRRRGLAWVALSLACVYAMLCGFPVSCQRSLCLFAMVMCGQLLDLDTDFTTSLSLGALAILLAQPGALFEAGFQLSFAVSLSLVVLTPLIEEKISKKCPGFLRTALAAALAAEVASVPLVAWHFGIYCWTALIAVICSAPLLGVIIALGLSCAILGIFWAGAAGLPAFALENVLKWLDWLSLHLAWLPHNAFSIGTPSALWMLSAFALALLFALWPKRRLLAPAALLLAWLLWPGLPWAHRHAHLTKAWFFSVGQGDSSLTEFEDGRTLLVDAGTFTPDSGSWTVGPALRRLGINQIDWAVVTHPHADHLGGMFWVLKQFPVKVLLHSGATQEEPLWLGVEKIAKEQRVPVTNLSQEAPPAAWEAQVEVVSPLRPRIAFAKQDTDNNGVVLRVGGWLLLTGDLQKDGEKRLLKAGRVVPCEVLKLGHHGSQTSTTHPFLAAVNPKTCVIQVGLNNRYRHPSPSTLEAIQGRELYRTDLQGCIYVEHDASGTRFQPWRQVNLSSLWQAPPKQTRFPWKNIEKQVDAADREE